jgi:hypothetical protein
VYTAKKLTEYQNQYVGSKHTVWLCTL